MAKTRRTRSKVASPVAVPAQGKSVTVRVEGRTVKLTNLGKTYFPELGYTKGDLIRYYALMAPVLLPHVLHRAMVMKRYPDGIHGEFFFMKRAPSHRPDWVQLCTIPHAEAGNVPFPVVQDLPTLLWIVNLGCIDLNPWYARCDDFDRPDYLHFDLDPVEAKAGQRPVKFERVLEVALIVRDALAGMDMPSVVKTTGSRGVHIYVPIERGPLQKDVWAVAKTIAQALQKQHPKLITTEYRISKRPAGRVLVDYNQNAWGRTLASVYSVRPREKATVSAPVTWKEVERGVRVEDFTLANMPDRVKKVGDLFAPVLPTSKPRVRLAKFLRRKPEIRMTDDE